MISIYGISCIIFSQTSNRIMNYPRKLKLFFIWHIFKIIIVGDQEPTKYIEAILFDIELQDKVNYLKCSLLDSQIYKRANIAKAKALYAFIDPTSSTYEIDAPQIIFLFMKDLNFVAPSVDIILFYAGSLKQHMHKPKIKLHEEFLVQTMKYFIIGTMVLNKGL